MQNEKQRKAKKENKKKIEQGKTIINNTNRKNKKQKHKELKLDT